jgi:hypothetical protein
MTTTSTSTCIPTMSPPRVRPRTRTMATLDTAGAHK